MTGDGGDERVTDGSGSEVERARSSTADGFVSPEIADRQTDPGPVDPPADPTGVAAAERAILDDVRAYFEDPPEGTAVLRTAGSTPDPEFLAERWFDLDPLSAGELREWQWVHEPFSLVAIVFHPESRTHRYVVVEPDLDALERYVREDMTRVIRNELMYTDLDDERARERTFADRVGAVIDEHASTVGPGTVQKLYYYFTRDFLGYGPLDPLMRDPGIEDISCNGERVPVYVYHREYRDLRTNVSFEPDELNSLAVRLAQRAGKHLSVSTPLVDASLDDGSRVQLTLGTDISSRGTNFTVRKFTDIPLTPVDVIGSGTFSVEQMAYFWLAIENNMSLVFAGGTGSGKTTSLNAVSFFIPPDSKVVSIEDTREVTLPHENWIQSVTRSSATASGRGEVTMFQLLQSALRQRPEYLLVGEIRTEQRVALTFFQAIGTGHTAYTTLHANSVESALARLENPPLSVPTQLVRNLDVVSVQRQVMVGDDRLRRNDVVAELVADDATGSLDSNVVFARDARADDHRQVGDSRVVDRIRTLRGWDHERVERELAERAAVLRYLVDEGITDYDDVAATIHGYSRTPEAMMEQIRADEFDPAALEREAE